MSACPTLSGLQWTRCAVLTTVCLVAAGSLALAGTIHPSLEARLSIASPRDSFDVWVFFTDRGFATDRERRAALDAAQEAISEEALARRALVGRSLADEMDLPVSRRYLEAVARLGAMRHPTRWLNGTSARLAAEAIRCAADLSFVREVRPVARGRSSGLGPMYGPDGRLLERIDPDSRMHRERTAAAALDDYGPSYDQLDEIGVIEAHEAGFMGARVRLMMLDTGFRKDHEAFAEAHLLAERDFIFGDGDTQNEPEDDPTQHWHGTATWGACGGYAPGALIGPAHRATFLLAKTEDIRSETQVEEDNYVAALEWADAYGVMLTSASLIYLTFDDGGGWLYEQLDGDTAPITRAVDAAAARGILCVNAMGNMGPDPGTLGEPADSDSMLACGAVDSQNSIANFSSRGPRVDGMVKPEVVARGVETWCADANDPAGYGTASGTSLSTPLVGGATALVMEAHPEWSAWQVRAALLQTADRAGAPNNDVGYGRINVWAAIQSAPMVVPFPFSLIAPSEGESVGTLTPSFAWERTRDPQNGTIAYEFWVDEDPAFTDPLVYTDLPDTSYTLPAPLTGDTIYFWRVFAEGFAGYRRLSREDRSFRTPPLSGTEDLPPGGEAWRLIASPNPWGPGSVLRFYAPPGTEEVREARLTILDASGRRVHRERIEITQTGWNTRSWDARGDGGALPSGVYLARLEASGRVARTKLVLTR